MTLSTGQRKYHHKHMIPNDPALKPYQDWPPENKEFLENFRTWLLDGGYSPSARNAYTVAARLALGLLDKPYQQIDPDSDLEQVCSHLRSRTLSPATCQHYDKGLVKLEEYLILQNQKPTRKKFHPPDRGYRTKTEQSINWEYYTNSLPDWLVDDVRAYVRHCRRNWRPERQRRAVHETVSHLTIILRWMTRHKKLDSIEAVTPELWNRFVETRRQRGISASTLNSDLHRIKSFLLFLEQEGRAICPRMKYVREMPGEPHISKDMPVEQIRSLLIEIKKEIQKPDSRVKRAGLMDRAWFLLMLYGGLRTCEVRFLRLQDIDWENRRLKIEQSKGFKERLIYLGEEVFKALKSYLGVRGQAAEGSEDRVFLYRHKTLGAHYCQARLMTYGERCKVKVTPHQLRYTCASLMLNSGVPATTVQTILGHKHIDTTLSYARLYDVTAEDEYRQAVIAGR